MAIKEELTWPREYVYCYKIFTLNEDGYAIMSKSPIYTTIPGIETGATLSVTRMSHTPSLQFYTKARILHVY